MMLLVTLLMMFVDEKPPAPSPITQGAITVPGEFEETTSAGDRLGLPRITPPAWRASPSWMVAAPSALRTASWDVFSSARRPPQDFPALLPCDSVALVPCPSPAPSTEAPAVRHVSFTDTGSKVQLAAHEESEDICRGPKPDCSPAAPMTSKACPPGYPTPSGMAFDPSPMLPRYQPGSPPPSRSSGMAFDPSPMLPWIANERGGHPFPPGMAHPHPPHPHHPPHPPVRVSYPHAEPICPVAGVHPVHGDPHLPGAKNVQHIVRATYDVPRKTAQALQTVLESSAGVQDCVVEGDELTINATPPAQAAIAHFLESVVTRPRMILQPKPTISVKHTKTQCSSRKCDCQGECQCCGAVPVKHSAKQTNKKCCNAKCDCPGECKCCGAVPVKHSVKQTDKKCCNGKCDCQGECQCACEKTKPDTNKPTAAKTALPRVFSFYVGRMGSQDCQASSDCKSLSPIKVIHHKTEPAKSIQVKIRATPEGVELWTSNGTRLRAQQIHFETGNVGKLRVEQAGAVGFDVSPQESAPSSTDPGSKAKTSSASDKENPGRIYRFGGVEIRR